MKYIILFITILLAGCIDSLEYVQIENQCDYKIYIHKDNGGVFEIAPKSKIDIKLIDLFTNKVERDGFMISIIDKGVRHNYYFNLNNKEFRSRYINDKIFDKDRYLFRYKMNKLYLFDPRRDLYKEVLLYSTGN